MFLTLPYSNVKCDQQRFHKAKQWTLVLSRVRHNTHIFTRALRRITKQIACELNERRTQGTRLNSLARKFQLQTFYAKLSSTTDSSCAQKIFTADKQEMSFRFSPNYLLTRVQHINSLPSRYIIILTIESAAETTAQFVIAFLFHSNERLFRKN